MLKQRPSLNDPSEGKSVTGVTTAALSGAYREGTGHLEKGCYFDRRLVPYHRGQIHPGYRLGGAVGYLCLGVGRE